MSKWLQCYKGRLHGGVGGSLGTPKSDYVIYVQPLKDICLEVDDKDKRDTTEKDQAAMPVDMASVDINKRNIRIFDEVFSADEEVQVNSLWDMIIWSKRSCFIDICNQTKALKNYYEKAGISEEKKLEVKSHKRVSIWIHLCYFRWWSLLPKWSTLL